MCNRNVCETRGGPTRQAYNVVVMRITRRELAGTIAGAASARASSPPAEQVRKAREELRENTEAIAKYDLPMATEPAFAFRA